MSELLYFNRDLSRTNGISSKVVEVVSEVGAFKPTSTLPTHKDSFAWSTSQCSLI